LRPGSNFEEVDWWRLDARTVNRLQPSQARLVREAVKRLRETESIDDALAVPLLAKTG
jgi:hypothetical protein